MNQNKPKKTKEVALQPAKPSQISKSEAIRQEITTAVKIRNLENPEPIKQALRYCFVLIGLRPEQIPDEIEKAVLLDFIKSNLANFTPEEIKIAFELAVKGEFQVDLKHFGKFSPVYFTSVFNKYIEHRNKIAKQVSTDQEKKRLQKENEDQANDPEFKKKVEKEFVDAVIKPGFEFFKENKRLEFGSTPISYVFNFLSKKELLDLSEEGKEKVKRQAKKRTAGDVYHAKNRFSVNKKESEIRKVLRDLATAPEAEKEIFLENCHKISIENFFESFKNWENVPL